MRNGGADNYYHQLRVRANQTLNHGWWTQWTGSHSSRTQGQRTGMGFYHAVVNFWIESPKILFVKECCDVAKHIHTTTLTTPLCWRHYQHKMTTWRQDFSNFYCKHITVLMWGPVNTSSLSSIWALWIKLRSLILMARIFPCWAILPAYTINL